MPNHNERLNIVVKYIRRRSKRKHSQDNFLKNHGVEVARRFIIQTKRVRLNTPGENNQHRNARNTF